MVLQGLNIDLTEYRPKYFPADYFHEETAKFIWQKFGKYVSIEQPCWRTENQWELTSNGWVGYIPLDENITIKLNPKVPIGNLFRMLEYAYRLKLVVVERLFEAETLDEFYERLARILAMRILDRKTKGLYRQYIDIKEELPFLRGRIQFQEIAKKPWGVNLPSYYQELTQDISDNQLLAWTMFVVIRSGICSSNTIPIVRKAYREMQRFVEVLPFSSKDCINRLYHRLNEDYEPMHVLCRFFLENSGPTINIGDHFMLPFLIDMAKLFELFVAEWLKKNLPDEYDLVIQDTVKFGTLGEIIFNIDVVINEKQTGKTIYVLDTKYKIPDSPASPDIHQIVSYSVAKQCNNAVLVYPAELENPFDGELQGINIRTLAFSVEGNIEDEGKKFLDQLFS
jgi:5-methylcytosine-specific restriction enzyme subunit McrC